MSTLLARMLAAIPEREEGQGVVEYALVLGVIVVAVFLAFELADVTGVIGDALARLAAVLPAP